MAVNLSEAFVERVAVRSFLSLWSFANPKMANGKEICDLLVVHGNDVVLFSVKEVKFGSHKDPVVNLDRWVRRAIHASGKQLSSAANRLARPVQVYTAGRQIALPSPEEARYTLIAVALGATREEAVAIPAGIDTKSGREVHVLDEEAFELLLTELDTITDFVVYLARKESAFQKTSVVMQDGEENLLAWYLLNNRSFFPEGAPPDHVLITSDMWSQYTNRPEVIRKRAADASSYDWDRLIESLVEKYSGDQRLLDQVEPCLRQMSSETRFRRRSLGTAFTGFVQAAYTGKAGSRSVIEKELDVAYVFCATPKSISPEVRSDPCLEKVLMVLVECEWVRRVVAISLDVTPGGEVGTSFELAIVDRPLGPELLALGTQLLEDRERKGVYTRTRLSQDEYPAEE